MESAATKTHLVTVKTPDGDRSFTVTGLNGEELRYMLTKAADGQFFRVVELDTAQRQGKALDHLSDATGILAILFVASAFLIRRVQHWLHH